MGIWGTSLGVLAVVDARGPIGPRFEAGHVGASHRAGTQIVDDLWATGVLAKSTAPEPKKGST